jgi:hypothetical protein
VVSGPAITTAATANGRRHHNAVAFAKIANSFTRFLHDANRLMPEDAAFFHSRKRAANEVQIRAADGACSNSNDRIGGLFELWVCDGLESNIANALKNDCFRNELLAWE